MSIIDTITERFNEHACEGRKPTEVMLGIREGQELYEELRPYSLEDFPNTFEEFWEGLHGPNVSTLFGVTLRPVNLPTFLGIRACACVVGSKQEIS